ncbi:MAG: flagellar basal body P-ring formation chaperone FlgA [Gammaproteobacteria bacterium]|nr:flagellar basal body P-ring formation chaperone FlgA [Gammaproteobacteria bacterium]
MNLIKTMTLWVSSIGLLLHTTMPLAERHSLASIQLQAEAFLSDYPYTSPYDVDFQLSKLDSRLNLKPCNSALDIRFTRADKVMGNTSVTIRCPQPVNWQIHLPVTVNVYDDVLVTKAPLSKGQTIDTRHLKARKENITRLSQGFFRSSDTLGELELKRNLSINTVITPAMLKPRLLVKSGQKVTITLDFKGMQIKSSGRALHSASLGQLVKVRNTHSNKVVEGIVFDEGQIRVGL